MSEARRSFFQRIRARMRLAWLSFTAQRLAPYLGALIAVAFAADWLMDAGWAPALSTGLVALFAALLLGRALTLDVSDWDVSRIADRGLGAHDVFTTALEFDDPDDQVHQAIQTQADHIAATSSPRDAIPIPAQPRRLRQFGLALVVALFIALLPPLGAPVALSADLQASLEAEAEEVERIAEAVEAAEVDNAEELAEELAVLAKRLREALTLDQALEALEETGRRLDAGADPQFLSQKAAVQGLARDLTLRPLVSGAPLDAASQLAELAQALDQLSTQELAALGDRLGDLAGSQSAGNPSLASQLSEASSALGVGDLQAARQALANAAADQRSGMSRARGQQALAETQRALDAVSARLGAQGQGSGQGQGQGPGQGSGPGQGGGAGQGGQGGSASPSGVISGVAPGDGNAQGQGGQGTVGGKTAGGYGTEVQTSRVYNPIQGTALSDLLQVHIEGGTGQGEVIGRGEAPTQRGESIVPYAQVLPEYLSEASDALSALRLPPAMRGIVQTYFSQLALEAR